MPITETTFGPKKYLTLKKSIAMSQVSDKDMYDQAGKKLGSYMQAHGIVPSGPWSVIYFTWDQAAGKTDLGIAFPVSGVEHLEDAELSLVEIPECKAVMDVLHGPYEGLAATHQGLMQYVQEKGYTGQSLPAMAVEEYAVDPMQEPNPANLVTNIYYLHT